MAEFLFEIGLEEVPARMIAGAQAELQRRVLAMLERERLIAGGAESKSFSTPRPVSLPIVDFREGISAPALGSSLYAIALLLLLGGFVLSVCGYLIKLPLRKYQVRG